MGPWSLFHQEQPDKAQSAVSRAARKRIRLDEQVIFSPILKSSPALLFQRRVQDFPLCERGIEGDFTL
jgi:hypothetical protein